MAFRHSEAQLFCNVCKALTRAQCESCLLPHCADHAPPKNKWCSACEAQFVLLKFRLYPRFAEMEAEADSGAIKILAYGLAPLCLVAAFTLPETLLYGSVALFLAATPSLISLEVNIARYRIRQARRRFLGGERPAALPPPKA